MELDVFLKLSHAHPTEVLKQLVLLSLDQVEPTSAGTLLLQQPLQSALIRNVQMIPLAPQTQLVLLH
jgi:hypothetical protein